MPNKKNIKTSPLITTTTRISILAMLAAGAVAACSSSSSKGPTGGPVQSPSSPVAAVGDDPFDGIEQSLTKLATQCKFDASKGAMTVTIADKETAVISKRATDSVIVVNGYDCDNQVAGSKLKTIEIDGTASATQTVVVDFTNGVFATGTSTGAGINVDSKSATHFTFGLRGTSQADTIVFGKGSDSKVGISTNGDKNKDIVFAASANAYIVSLGAGKDTYTGSGSKDVGLDNPFGGTIAVYGGSEGDTFNEGNASTVNETIHGGSGLDTIDYSKRTNALKISAGTNDSITDGGAFTLNDGETGEGDDIWADIETINGGDGDDTITLTGSVDAVINGNKGNDTLGGGSGSDTLNGGDGNDTFDEGKASNGKDVFNGGAGTDTISYASRTSAVTITLDGKATSGESSESDTVKNDVENCVGGSGGDTITGSDVANTITGGLGDDTLNGGKGDDIFDQGSDPLSADGGTSPDVGTPGSDDDTINGGDGFDLVTYASRTNAVTISLVSKAHSGQTGEADLITNVENLTGGDGNDTITGDDGPNELTGGPGDDTIYGCLGDDTIDGSTGNNKLVCEGGDGDIAFNPGSGGTKDPSCEF